MNVKQMIDILLIKRDKNKVGLAKLLGCAPSNISGKYERNSFRVKDLEKIASLLDYDMEITFIDRKNGERICFEAEKEE